FKRRRIELRGLDVDAPHAAVLVGPDGTTNVPRPKIEHPSNTSGLDTIVDLAIGHFQINQGLVQFADQTLPISARGENLRAELAYELVGDQYRGRIGMSPLYVQSGANPRLNADVELPVVLGRDRIELSDANVRTPASALEISAKMTRLVSPQISGR